MTTKTAPTKITATAAKAEYARAFAHYVERRRNETKEESEETFKDAAANAMNDVRACVAKVLDLAENRFKVRLEDYYREKGRDASDICDHSHYVTSINGHSISIDNAVGEEYVKTTSGKLAKQATDLAHQSSTFCKYNDNPTAQRFAVDLYLRSGGNCTEKQVNDAIVAYLERLGCTC